MHVQTPYGKIGTMGWARVPGGLKVLLRMNMVQVVTQMSLFSRTNGGANLKKKIHPGVPTDVGLKKIKIKKKHFLSQLPHCALT